MAAKKHDVVDEMETIDTPTSFDNLSPAEQLNEKTAAQISPSPPPTATPIDGGTRAWLQVLGSFIVFGNLWGLPFCWGAFQNYYELTYLPSQTSSDIAWIGTITMFLLILTGIISGPLFDMGYFKSMLLVGALTETFGIFMVSLCTQYWAIFLTQGVIVGLANGLLYLPGMALVGRSFRKNRALAMGIVTCGAPVGGVIYTMVFESLITPLGFGWTVRVIAFLMLGTYSLSFPLLLYGARNLGDISSAGTKRKLFDKTAFSDGPFWSYSLSNFFIFMGYMIPFFFIPTFAQLELDMPRSWALYTVTFAQASSILGRLVASYTASRIGVMIPWIVCVATSAILNLSWIAVRERGALIAFSVLYGAFSGALIPLPPSIFPVVCPDPSVLGARLGMAQGLGSVASLIGSPIAGALSTVGVQGRDERNYLGLQLWGGLVMLVGAGNLMILWWMLVRTGRAGGKLV
jgi:MFS family permease